MGDNFKDLEISLEVRWRYNQYTYADDSEASSMDFQVRGSATITTEDLASIAIFSTKNISNASAITPLSDH